MATLKVREKITTLPKEPGCYLMKDSLGRIIYVGKAKSLKARVSQYFGTDQSSLKTRVLVENIADFELIITQTEVEALLLERTLIKHHKPRFNVLLRDDKEYPFLRINFQEPWPRIEKVRRRKDDGATYLGPFSSSGQLRVLMDTTMRIFPLVRCSRHEFAQVRRPCNYYNMKLCLGPCTLPVPPEQYHSTVRDAVDFLSGKSQEVLKTITSKMQAAATDERYELAALYRDQLKAFSNITEKQNVIMQDLPDADVIGVVPTELKTSFHVLTIRNLQLVGQDSFVLRSEIAEPEDALVQFLLQYYESRSLPRELILPFELAEGDQLRLALLTGHPDAVQFTMQSSSRGTRKDLVAMAEKNAAYKLTELDIQAENARTELLVLKEKLNLHHIPKRMECIDISNIQGSAIVASNVCFVDGRPAKELYRHYNIKSIQGTADDFGSVAEVVERRLERGINEGDLPQLLIIDGGKGQLKAAWTVLEEFKKHHPPSSLAFDLIALAKAKGQTPDGGRARHGPMRAFERVFFVGQEVPLALNPGTPEFRLLTQIRDEAHRFAISHHRKVRSKNALTSSLTEIPGIGLKMQQKLITQFGNWDRLRTAPLEELVKVKGLRKTTAVALHSHLQNLREGIEVDPQGETLQAKQEGPPHGEETFELAIRINPGVEVMEVSKQLVMSFLEAHGFPEYVEAMIDGIQDSLPEKPEDLWDFETHGNQGHAPLLVFHPQREILEGLVALIKAQFGDDTLTTAITAISNESWQQAWDQDFEEIQTQKIRVVAYDEKLGTEGEQPLIGGSGQNINIFIKPGKAFGDGRHKTTRVCLEMLDDITVEVEGNSYALDVGTGNGILAVAESLLGFKTVVLTDLSPEIIAEAAFHGQLHHVEQGWQTHVTDQIPPSPSGRGYDLITANILAPILHQLLADMAQQLAPQGSLILAGFIRKEAGPLIELGKKLGLSVVAERECQGWVGLRLQWTSL